jgi:hypothetical protein
MARKERLWKYGYGRLWLLKNLRYIGCSMLLVLSGGCQTMGSDLPSRMEKERAELQRVNDKLYDHLQILVWTGKYNGKNGNAAIYESALDGCMEIIGHPDAMEKVVAENMGMVDVEGLVKDTIALVRQKEKLICHLGRDSNLLAKRYGVYENSHRTLNSVKRIVCAGAVVGVILLVFGCRFR